jgi:hypothetical protein
MSLQAITGDIDPLGWARRPRSQTALDRLRDGGCSGGVAELQAIVTRHVEEGVCTAEGRLLKRWDGLQWVAA